MHIFQKEEVEVQADQTTTMEVAEEREGLRQLNLVMIFYYPCQMGLCYHQYFVHLYNYLLKCIIFELKPKLSF